MAKYLTNVDSIGFVVHTPPQSVRILRGLMGVAGVATLVVAAMAIARLIEWYWPLIAFALAVVLRELMKRRNGRNKRLEKGIALLADLRDVKVHLDKFTGYDARGEQVNGLIEYRGKYRTEIGIIRKTA